MGLLPLLGGEAERIGVGRRAAGVGDEDVDRAHLLGDARDQARSGVEVGAVPGQAGGRADLRGHLRDAIGVARGDDHARALGHEHLGHGAADALAGAPDERHASLDPEVHAPHPTSPSRSQADARAVARAGIGGAAQHVVGGHLDHLGVAEAAVGRAAAPDPVAAPAQALLPRAGRLVLERDDRRLVAFPDVKAGRRLAGQAPARRAARRCPAPRRRPACGPAAAGGSGAGRHRPSCR